MALKEYRVNLYWNGYGLPPHYTYTDYGFLGNPPITIRAKNMANARKQLKLPKSVKISDIKCIRRN